MSILSRRALLINASCLMAGSALGWLGSRFIGDPTPRTFAEEAATGAEAQIKKLKLELPEVKAPKGATLVPTVRVGDTLYVSGHIPLDKEGKPITGKVGKDVKLKDAQEAARRIGLTILAVVRKELGSLNKVVRLVKTLGMVNCTPDFTQQAQVVNGFSDLMVQVFGDKMGKGTRSAVGMASLPLGVPVEVECIFQVK